MIETFLNEKNNILEVNTNLKKHDTKLTTGNTVFCSWVGDLLVSEEFRGGKG